MFQFFCVFGPAQSGERPQCRREPCIQCIFILSDIFAAAFFTFAGVCFCYCDMTAVCAVVSRDSVTPPQLTGNTPVADIFQPVHIDFAETVGNEFQFLILVNFHCRFCQFFHFYEPLQFDHGFDYSVTSFMAAYCMVDVFDFDQVTFFFQLFNDGFSCFHSAHTAESASQFVHCTVIVHYANARQVMANTNFEVVRVMCGCDFYNTCTKFSVYIVICNDGNFFIQNGNDTCFADQVLISFIFGMNRYSCIAQHCFRSCCCQSQFFVGTYDRIVDVVEVTSHIVMFYFCVRDRCLAFRAPVDDLFTTVDITFFIQSYECFQNSIGAAFVHCKTNTIPVTGAAQFAQLIQDDTAVFFFPCPCSFQEAFTAYVVLCQAFGSHFLNNLQFCGNGCMVDTGYPQCIVASHSLPSDQDILHCVIQGMAHVQLTCDVRRGHYDTKRFFGFVNFCMEIFLFHPCVVKSFLYNRGVKIFCQLSHDYFPPAFLFSLEYLLL